MFRLIDRYILKEIFPPFLIGLLVCTFVLMMNQILLLSEFFIGRGVPFKAILSLFIYLIPSILAFTVPMSVLMSILAGLSRMSSDYEIMAFKTLGISYKRLLRPILLFAFGGLILTAVLTLYIGPRTNYKYVQIFVRSIIDKVDLNIFPREFNETIPNTVIYVQDIAPNKEWRNLFVYFFPGPNEDSRMVFAKRGKLNYFADERRATLEFFDGAIHTYPVNEPERYGVTRFRHSEEEIDVSVLYSSSYNKKNVREKDIIELYEGVASLKEEITQGKLQGRKVTHKQRSYAAHWIEIHKKFALPFACLIFAFLGIPLGASTKKGGRTSGFTLSIGIIVIYYILITAGEEMAMNGQISAWIGMWGANILFGIIGIFIFIRSVKETRFFSTVYLFRKIRDKEKAVKKTDRPVRLKQAVSLPFPNILDRYVIRKYIFIFTLVMLGMLAILIIVTFFERIGQVYEHEKPVTMFLEYIWFRIPDFLKYILPITALTAAVLSLGLLSKFNEITAMKACGISLYRIIVPLLFMGLLVSFISLYIQENVLPLTNRKTEEIWAKIQDKETRSYSRVDHRWVMGKDKNRIYYYRHFDRVASSFSQMSIFDFDPVSWDLMQRFYSETARLGDGSLVLTDSWSRTFIDNVTVAFEQEDRIELTGVEPASYFVKEWKEPDQMNYFELRRYIKEIEERDFETVKFKVDLSFKLSFPLISLIMTLLGIAFASAMGKRGALVGIGMSVAIAMVYWGAVAIFKSLGNVDYISPLWAAWGPNLIFGLIGIYLILNLRT